MDIIRKIEQLARHALREKCPVFHVTDQVMAGIQTAPAEDIFVFGCFGGISVLAASIVLTISFQAWHFISHPLVQIMAPLQDINLW